MQVLSAGDSLMAIRQLSRGCGRMGLIDTIIHRPGERKPACRDRATEKSVGRGRWRVGPRCARGRKRQELSKEGDE